MRLAPNVRADLKGNGASSEVSLVGIFIKLSRLVRFLEHKEP